MKKEIDASGLSCPQPVILAINAMKDVKLEELAVRFDTQTTKENLTRAAKSQGWEIVDVKPETDGYVMTLIRKRTDA